jgi:hypothetical protein
MITYSKLSSLNLDFFLPGGRDILSCMCTCVCDCVQAFDKFLRTKKKCKQKKVVQKKLYDVQKSFKRSALNTK